jgi:predicted dehydrogenase
VESASSSFHGWDEHTQVYFKGGWIKVWAPPFFSRPAQSRVECYSGGDAPSYSYPVARPLTAWHYREEAAFFVRALRTGQPFPSSGEDTLTDVRLCEELYRAHLGILSR